MSAPTQPESADLRPTAAPPATMAHRWLRYVLGTNNLYILLVLIALMAFFSVISPNHAFFGTSNFLNIVWDSAETLLLAIGETFVIITAGIDLSVGTVLMVS